MRIRILSLLALAFVFISSLAVVGCKGEGAEFTVSNLVISPTSVQVGDEVQISATVANSGGASGNYNFALTVGGIARGSQTVEVAAGASATVTFDYTPEASGTFTVVVDSASGSLSGSLTVDQATGYWEIPYKAVAGSGIVDYYSVAGITPLTKAVNFDESFGIRFTMRISKSVVDGAREVVIPAETWVWPTFTVPDMLPGIDADITMPLVEDSIGTLYVQDGIGDVDISSVSTGGQSPIQVDTYGDGTKDPAGSMMIPILLGSDFYTSIGQKGDPPPFHLIFTTGHIDNTIHVEANKKMDGAFAESDGVPFAKDGGVADYTGTAGTITTTGTGEYLGIKLVGSRLDLQWKITLVLEPAE